jgi:hypothetical protein
VTLTPEQVKKDVGTIQHDAANHVNINHVTQGLDHDEQLQIIREVGKAKLADPKAWTDIEIVGDEGGLHLQQKNLPATTPDVQAKGKGGEVQDPNLPNTGIDWGSIHTEAEQLRAKELKEYHDHPEREAQSIEQLANTAMGEGHDANVAKLKLRQELEKLMKDPDTEFRDKVLKQMESDGERWKVWNGAPHVELSRDAEGNPTSINFSRYGGIYSETVPLNVSVEQQRADARVAFDQGRERAISSPMAGDDPVGLSKVVEDIGNQRYPERWWNVDRQHQ